MGEELIIGGMPFYFDASDADGNTARRTMNIFSPYTDYTNGGVTRNVTFPEVVITPDSKRSPGARAVLERQRRRQYDAQNGLGSYNGLRTSESPAIDLVRSRREVANSPYVKAANYAADAMAGVGMGADIAAGLPIYSTLRGARELSKGNYLEGGLWLTPYLKPVAGGIKAGVNGIVNLVKSNSGVVQDVKNWRPFVPINLNRYYRIVGQVGNPITDASESGVIRGPGAVPGYRDAIKAELSTDPNTITLLPKAHDYPMFAKGHPWRGSTARQDTGKPTIIRSKADTGNIVWEESNKDFRHKGHAGIYRPRYNGDLNSAPTKYFEYWEPKRFGYVRRDFPQQQFQSELNWDPQNWFGNRINGSYDKDDVASLISHIPEYLQIEKQAKQNGTWLKMVDGSTWDGDPRSWVQLMSKDGGKLQKRILYHGDDDTYLSHGMDVTPETIGNKILWTSTNKYLPATYGSNRYQLTIPNGVSNTVFDAEGRFWNNLSAPSGYKYRNTNDVSLDLLKDNNTVNINNVVDVGPSIKYKPGINGMPDVLPSEKLYDYYDRVFKGDDVILGKDVPRKSLLGNNGDFDLLNKNIYKSLIPASLMAPWMFTNDDM